MVCGVIYNFSVVSSESPLTRFGFIAPRYKYVNIPKNKKTIKLKTKNFFRIELELKKLDFIN